MDNIKDLRKTFLQSARLRQKELTNELSQCDLALSDAMHFLENETRSYSQCLSLLEQVRDLDIELKIIK